MTTYLGIVMISLLVLWLEARNAPLDTELWPSMTDEERKRLL